MKLWCYAVELRPPRLVPAAAERDWMEGFAGRHPYRCLPLSVANVYGWSLLSPATFSIHWDGGPDASDIRFECHDGYGELGRYVSSNFNRGIVTFQAGYIFRTEPGWNLLVTGPLNAPKDGISPLSGVVETDWLPYTFTMNWQLTRPGTVRFEKDEPFCQLVPTPKQFLEETELEIVNLESDRQLTEDYRIWRDERDWFRVMARAGEPKARREAWQKFYFHGELPGRGRWTEEHTHKLRLQPPNDLRDEERGSFAGQSVADSAASSASVPVADEGYVPVSGGRVWYRRYGAGAGTPLVVLAGGPGFPHDYLAALAELGDERPVVLFDQLGSGRSDRPTDLQWYSSDQIALRVEQMCAALGIQQSFLLGHGFGAAQALDLYLRRPTSVKGLVLASPLLSMAVWKNDTAQLLATLPEPMRELLPQLNTPELIGSEVFQSIVRAYLRKYLCRREPWPAALEWTLAGLGPVIYPVLWGPNPLECTGALRGFDARPQLGSVRVPTLLTCGRFDQAAPESVESYQRQIPGAERAVFEESSHTPQLEQPVEYLATVRAFLQRADR